LEQNFDLFIGEASMELRHGFLFLGEGRNLPAETAAGGAKSGSLLK
jgi:hypothetical protein